MKKISILLAAFFCVFLLVACGTNEKFQIESDSTSELFDNASSPETELVYETETIVSESSGIEQPVSEIGPDIEIETELIPETEPVCETEVVATELPSTETPETEAEPKPLVPQVERNDDYFDHSIFIGDSIMAGIERYVMISRYSQKTLGNAKFLTSVYGISLADLVNDRQSGIYYSYQGVSATVEEIVASIDSEIEIKHIFLMLGQNDLVGITNPSVMEIVNRYPRLIESLSQVVPDADFIILTNTPKVSSEWLPDYIINRNYTNELIDEFVDALIEMCQVNDIQYLDTNSLMKDGNNALRNEYCSDGFAHLTNAGAKIVVDALYEFAAGRE